MGKKKPAKQPKAPPRFAAGALVRVRPGTADPDFGDVPLGGWAGVIREVDQRSSPPLYLIAWNKHTLDNMHPVYRKRCERDGLDFESMWLSEEDVEPDTGRPAVLEQPTRIVTRPLNEKNQDDRVCIALGLTADDPLPEVDDDTLLAYHRYLSANLSFPFEASWEQESGSFSTRKQAVTITGLADPEDDDWADEEYGLLCRAKLEGRVAEIPLGECEAKKAGPNRRLLKDYAYWFWNNR